jgi:N-acetylneuraminate lyase
METIFLGAWPALITPATADGSVNFKVMHDLVEYLLGKGSGGLYLCGSTGEGLFQTTDERKQVVEAVIAQVNGRVPVIVHVGTPTTRESVALARHASQVGASGISSVLPMLNPDLQSIYLHYQSIAAAAPNIPFFPYLFGARTDAVTLMRELITRIPNLGGSKYTGPDMFEIRNLIDMPGAEGWTIFSGMDEECVFAAMSGVRCNIGSTLNAMPGVYCEIHRRVESGELQRAVDLQLKVNRVTRTLISFGFLGAFREMLRMIGLDCGEPRQPSLPLPAEKRAALHEQLEREDYKTLVAM